MSTAASPPVSERQSPAARRVVVMGVSGCGKSTLADAIGRAPGWRAVDGDALHSPASIDKMRRGEPLTDDDRWPWLDRVGAALCAPDGGAGVVVACSALRRAYRDRLRQAAPGLHFVLPHGPRALLLERMQRRRDHFMPVSLLDSQLATLELPAADEHDVLMLPLAATLPMQLEITRHWLGTLPAPAST